MVITNYIIKNRDGSKAFNIQFDSHKKISKKTVEKNFHQRLKTGERTDSFEIKGIQVTVIPASPLDYLEWKESQLTKHQGFLQRLSRGAGQFFNWLLRRSPKESIEETEFLFAFHLFRNAESELLPKSHAKNLSLAETALGQDNLKFSQILKIWGKFIEEMSPFLSDEEQEATSQLIATVQNLYAYEKQIDKIRAITNNKKRDNARERLTQQILQDAKTATTPFYLPESFVTDTKHSIIYELTQMEGNTLQVRVIDLSHAYVNDKDEAQPELPFLNSKQKIRVTGTYRVEGENPLETFISTTLKTSIGPFNPLTDLQLKSPLKIAKALKEMQAEAKKEKKKGSERKEEKEDSNPIAFTEIKEESPLHASPGRGGPEKIFELFLKSTQPTLYDTSKSLLQISTFFNLYDKGQSRLENPQFRNWLLQNGTHLLESLKKRNNPENAFIVEKLQNIIKELTEHGISRSTPAAPAQQKKQTEKFAEVLTPSSLQSSSSHKKIKTQSKTTIPLDHIKFDELDFEERAPIVEQFQGMIADFRNLAKGGEFGTLDLLLQDAFNLLDQASEVEFWDALTPDEAKQWSPIVRDLGLIRAQTQWAQGRVAPVPRDIYNMLKSIEIGDRLYRKGDLEGHFKGFRFDTEPYEILSRDPYLSLGEYGGKIKKTLDYLADPDPDESAYEVIKFTISNTITSTNEEFQYLKRLNPALEHKFHFLKATLEQSYMQDMGEKKLLPSQFVDLRKLYMITQASWAPLCSLDVSAGEHFKVEKSLYTQIPLAVVAGNTVEVRAKQKSNQIIFEKKVIEKLTSITGEIEFVPGKLFFTIAPWNLKMQNFYDFNMLSPLGGWDNSSHANTAVFKEGGIPIPDDENVQQKLFEQNVGLKDNEVRKIDDEGKKKIFDSKDAFFGMTQTAILREKLNLLGLPSDVIQELELIHTGDKTRVKEAIGKLSKHAGLLNDPARGPILQRLFEQVLFRRGHLLLQLKDDPEYSTEVMRQLKEIALRMHDSHNYRSYLFVVQLVDQLSLCFETLSLDDHPAYALAKEQIASFLDENEQIMEQLKKKAGEGTPPYGEYQRDFHYHSLLQTAYRLAPALNGSLSTPPAEDIQLDEVLYSYFMIQTSSAPQNAQDPRKEDIIAYMMHRLHPLFLDYTQDAHTKNELCNTLMNSLLPNEAPSERQWEQEDENELLFKSEEYALDLSTGYLWINNQRSCRLPDSLTKRPAFDPIKQLIKRYVPKTNLDTVITTAETIELEGLSGQQYEFNAGEESFRLVSMGNNAIYLYKKVNNAWCQQLLFPEPEEESAIDEDLTEKLSFSTGKKVQTEINDILHKSLLQDDRFEAFPRELIRYDCWISDDHKKVYVEHQGQPFLEGKLHRKTKKGIEQLSLVSLREVSREKAFAEPFVRIEHLNSLVNRLFPDAHCQATHWKANGQIFKAKNFIIDFDRGVVVNNQKRSFLNPWKNPAFGIFKAIDAPAQITIKGNDGKAAFCKYNRFNLAYYYDTENQRWSADQYEGYYLSSQTLREYFTSEAGEDKSALAHVFSSHFSHYQLLEHDNGRPKVVLSGVEYPMADSLLTRGLKKQAKELIPDYKTEGGLPLYVFTADPNKGLVAEDSPDGYFYLSYVLLAQGKHQEAIRYLKKASLNRPLSPTATQIVSWMEDRLKDSSNDTAAFKTHLLLLQKRQAAFLKSAQPDSAAPQLLIDHQVYQTYLAKINEGKIPFELQLSPAEARELKGYFKVVRQDDILEMLMEGPEEAQKKSYRREIGKLEAAILEREKETLPEIEKTALEAPILIFATIPIGDYFHIETPSSEQEAFWQERLATFEQNVVLGQEDPYAQEIGQELYDDLKIYLNERMQTTASIVEDQRPALQEALKAEHSHAGKQAREAKRAALELLPQPIADSSQWEALLNQFKERNVTWRESLFDTALRCFGENDWSVLQKLYPDTDDFEPLKLQLTHYLKAAIREQQLGKAMLLAEKDTPNAAQELHQLLSQGWYYDPDADVDRGSFLLAEYELGLISRQRQVEQIRSAIHHPDKFKQEICGGGKTTFLRPVISHLRANGAYLSCISTLEPLRQTHSVLFSKTTLHAFGEHTFEFQFSRQSPSDETSLLKLHRNLLWMIVNRGRMDLTKGDLLSFKLEQTLKQEQLRKLRTEDPSSSDIDRLNWELDVMENIRDLLRERALINADELDKDCDPTQEKNYAYGDQDDLNQNKVEAGLDIFNEILKAKKSTALGTLKEVLGRNKQYKLNEQEINAARQVLAGKLFSKYQTQLGLQEDDQQAFIEYLTEIKPEESKAQSLYETYLQKPGDIQQRVCFAHEFIAQLFPHALNKMGGVNFGRALDGVHVIPHEGSDKPNERSQHSLESEQIFYTCLDYLDTSRKGITKEQVGLLVQNSQKKAMDELRIALKKNPDSSLTFAKTKTAKKFHKAFGLSLAGMTSADYQLLADQINSSRRDRIAFLRDWIFPEYQNYSEKIVSDAQDPPSMVRAYSGSAGTDSAKYALPDSIDTSTVKQPGVHGEIIASLLEIEAKMGDKAFIEVKETPKGAIKALAEEIKGGDCLSDVAIYFPGIPAEQIARDLAKKRPELVFRFMNRNDEWKMLKGKKIDAVDPTVPLDQIFTIFDDTHTRGAERPSMDNVTEYLTGNQKTAWSRFEQGALRERGVTKKKADIRHMVPPALMEQWGNEPSVTKLIALNVANEAAALKPLNLKAEKQRIKAITRHQVESSVREITRAARKKGKSSHHAARELIHEHTRRYFVRPNEHHDGAPFEKKSGGEVLDDLTTFELGRLQKLISEEGDLMTAAKAQGKSTLALVKAFCEAMKPAEEKLNAKLTVEADGDYKPRVKDELVPDTAIIGGQDLDNEQAVEQETEQEQSQEMQQEMQQESQVEQRITNKTKGYRKLGLEGKPPQELCDFLCHGSDEPFNALIHPLNAYNRVQSPHVFFTENFSEVVRTRGVLPWGILADNERIPRDQNRISRVLIVIDLNKNKAGGLITSLKENDKAVEPYIKAAREAAAAEGILLSTYNIDTDSVDGGARWDELTLEQLQAAREVIVPIKFQNGEVNFPDYGDAELVDNQYQTLVNWLMEMNEDLDAVEKSIKTFIAQNRISNKYAGSDLQRAFKEAKQLQAQTV